MLLPTPDDSRLLSRAVDLSHLTRWSFPLQSSPSCQPAWGLCTWSTVSPLRVLDWRCAIWSGSYSSLFTWRSIVLSVFLILLQLCCVEFCLRVCRCLNNWPCHSELHVQRCSIRAFATDPGAESSSAVTDCVVAVVSLWSVWSGPLGQMPPPAHVSVIRHASCIGIADVSFTCSDPVGAVLPASNLIVVSILTCTWWFSFDHCHEIHCHVVICQQSLVSPVHRPGPSVSSCSGTSHDLLFCSNTFSARLSLSQTINILASLPCLLLSMLFDCTPICIGTKLLSMYCCVLVIWGSPSALVCSSQFLCFPRWDKLQLAHPPSSAQSHLSWCRRSLSPVTDTRVSVLHPLVAVSVCLSVCKRTRSSGVQQTLAPILSRTAFSLRALRSHMHCETPVQCFHHRKCAAHLRVESLVESRCRRFFCRRGFQFVPLVHGSEIWSQFEQPIRTFIGSSCVVDEAFWTCFTSSFLVALRIVASTWYCWSCTFKCWMAIVICSTGVDMVCWYAVLPAVLNSRIHRGCPRLIPSSVRSHWPRSLLTVLTPVSPWALRSTLSHSELSASTRQQVSMPVFRDSITVSFFREATITGLRYHDVNLWDGSCTQGMILSDWTTLLNLCVSSTAHMLSQSSSVPWQVCSQIVLKCL